MADAWRLQPLPPGWPALRRQVLDRDHQQCTARRRDETRCPARATDVHHIGDRDDHTLTNLISLCGWHHRRITSAEANAARNKYGRAQERRPRPKHPGEL